MGSFDIGSFLTQPEHLVQIEIDLLVPYHNHKFALYKGERLNDMVQSIKDNGVLTPIIVRPDENNNGKYEILAGHNRCNAAKIAGLQKVPGIIKSNLSDNDAEMYVIETNLMQRGFDDLSISEQATVVSQRHSAMFNEEKVEAIRKELACLDKGIDEDDLSNAVYKQDSKEESKLVTVGKAYGLSKNSIARLIRINTLYDKYKDSIDLKLLSIRAGVELSYVPVEIQEIIFNKYKEPMIHNNVCIDVIRVDMQKAHTLRFAFEKFNGTTEQVNEILDRIDKKRSDAVTDEKAAIKEKPIKITMQPDLFHRFFKSDVKPDEIADTISKALELYFSENNSDEESLFDTDEAISDPDEIQSIDDLDLPINIYNALKRQHINNVGELKDLMADISTAENILGIKIVKEIQKMDKLL